MSPRRYPQKWHPTKVMVPVFVVGFFSTPGNRHKIQKSAVLKGFQLQKQAERNVQNHPSHKSLGHFLWDDFWPTPEMLKKQPLAANFGHEPEGQGGPIACLDGWARAGLSGIVFFSQLFLVARYDVFLLDNIIPFCICLVAQWQ